MTGGAPLRRSGFLSESFALGLGLVVPNVLQFAFFAVLGRALVPVQYGGVAVLAFVVAIASAPALVANALLTARVTEARLTGELGATRRIAGRWTGGAMIAGLLPTAVCLACASRIASFLQLDDVNAVRWLGAALATGLPVLVQRGGFQGEGRFRAYVYSNVVEAIVKFVGGWAVAVWHGGTTAAIVVVAASFGAALLYGAAAGLPPTWPKRLSRTELLRDARGGAAMTVLTALVFVDTLVAKHVLSPADGALYGTIALLGRAEYIALSVFTVTALARAREGGGAMLRRALIAVATLVGTGSLVAFCAARFLLGLIGGPRYAVDTPALGLYVLAIGELGLATTAISFAVGRRDVAIVTAGAMLVVVAAEATAFTRLPAHVTTFAAVLAAGHGLVAMVCLADSFRPRALVAESTMPAQSAP